MDILERAIKANVIISTLDARGLFTDPSYDASTGGGGRGGSLSAAIARSNILAELAAGTGGTFYQNSNDVDEGFRRLAAAPEYIYLLGFSPQNLKLDGSFHSLKVTLKNGGGVTIQARHGYYAPRHMEDEAENARQEIESALFSREEILELPIDMHTQFFKSSDQSARVSVLAHLNLKLFKFQKVGRRPGTVARQAGALAGELGKVASGKSAITPARRDRRFSDPAWNENPMLKRAVQTYLAVGQTVKELLGDAELDWRDNARLKFVLTNLIAATAPSNYPLISPVAWKALIDT